MIPALILAALVTVTPPMIVYNVRYTPPDNSPIISCSFNDYGRMTGFVGKVVVPKLGRNMNPDEKARLSAIAGFPGLHAWDTTWRFDTPRGEVIVIGVNWNERALKSQTDFDHTVPATVGCPAP